MCHALPTRGGLHHCQRPQQPLLHSAGSWDLCSPVQDTGTSMQRIGAASLGALQALLAALQNVMKLSCTLQCITACRP